MLLVTVLFAALLAINRLFVAERDEGGFDAIRLAPVDLSALFAAKVVALLVYLLVLEAIALPVFAAFFLDDAGGPAAAGGHAGAARTWGSRPPARSSPRSAPTRARATC